MNLLLLLSALLSALTGVGASARGLAPVTAVAERVAPAQAPHRAAETPQRPVAADPTRAALARAKVLLTAPPVPSVPLYLLRRRE